MAPFWGRLFEVPCASKNGHFSTLSGVESVHLWWVKNTGLREQVFGVENCYQSTGASFWTAFGGEQLNSRSRGWSLGSKNLMPQTGEFLPVCGIKFFGAFFHLSAASSFWSRFLRFWRFGVRFFSGQKSARYPCHFSGFLAFFGSKKGKTCSRRLVADPWGI